MPKSNALESATKALQVSKTTPLLKTAMRLGVKSVCVCVCMHAFVVRQSKDVRVS